MDNVLIPVNEWVLSLKLHLPTTERQRDIEVPTLIFRVH